MSHLQLTSELDACWNDSLLLDVSCLPGSPDTPGAP